MGKIVSSLIAYCNVRKAEPGKFGCNQYLIELANLAIKHPQTRFDQFGELMKARGKLSLIEGMTLPGQFRVANGSYQGITLTDEEGYSRMPFWVHEYRTSLKLNDAVETAVKFVLKEVASEHRYDQILVELFYDDDVVLEQELYQLYERLEQTKHEAVSFATGSIVCGVVAIIGTLLATLAMPYTLVSSGLMFVVVALSLILAVILNSKGCQYSVEQTDINDEINRKRVELIALRR